MAAYAHASFDEKTLSPVRRCIVGEQTEYLVAERKKDFRRYLESKLLKMQQLNLPFVFKDAQTKCTLTERMSIR